MKYYTMNDICGFVGMTPHRVAGIIRALEIKRDKRKILGQLRYVLSERQFDQIMKYAGYRQFVDPIDKQVKWFKEIGDGGIQEALTARGEID